MASVFIREKAPEDRVTVEISSTGLIKPSRMSVPLPDADTVYEISPHLKYAYEKLLSIRQPSPEDITAKVYLNDALLGEKTRKFVVRPINDYFYGLLINDGKEYQDWSEMFAAYVNEDDPIIDGILGEALKKDYVDSFDGYQNSPEDVLLQVQWKALQDRDLKYSNIATTSVESDTVRVQHVRLISDSARGAQANCADGSVLLASIFRKLGFNAFLILLPGHMLVGVGRDANNSQIAYIETTLISKATLAQAIDSAETTLEKYVSDNDVPTDQGIVININAAREAGILPLRARHQ